METHLRGKTVVITGATSGIGYQAALDLACEGAFIIGAGRDAERCAQAKEKILTNVPGAGVEFAVAELSLQSEVRNLAAEIRAILQAYGKDSIDLLVNNAGMVNDRKVLTADGVERTFAVNHVAPFYLTHLLLPELSIRRGSRILTVSSNSHYHTRFDPARAANPHFYFIMWAYKVSKLSNVLFSVEFNRRNPRAGLKAFAIDPGLVNTSIGRKGTGWLVSLAWGTRQKQGDDPEMPSKTILRLAGDLSESEMNEVYWKDSMPKRPSPVALEPEIAGRLWEESCRICGINDFFGE